MSTGNFKSDYTEGDIPQIEMEAFTRDTKGRKKIIDITGFIIEVRHWHPTVPKVKSPGAILDAVKGLAKFLFPAALIAGDLYYEWLITDTAGVNVTSQVRFKKYVRALPA